MKLALLCVFGLFLQNSLKASPLPSEDRIEFTKLSAFNQKSNSKWGTVLKDIMNHEAPGDSNHYKDRITLGHETTHGINNYIRNKMGTSGKKVNGFYVLEDRAVVLDEPNMRKHSVAAYVPKNLRGFRYSTYVTGQTSWDERPLYLFDEWVAYVNGSAVGVDLVNKGLWNEAWQDGVYGTLEFVVYSLATAMAIRDNDPDYFNHYAPFTDFLAWNIKRSMDVYKAGSVMTAFKWDTQDKYLEALRASPEARAMRDFSLKTFGVDWCHDVLGF